ncbi:hypothetical protein STRTUCAR8_01207 [Streptomyces turgidiscabies Car8]|uniref:Uncharacterized protein n=1 Tax=Streptomyces turgidiscabies (strain Car8) TaxID=698760 RepID=L7FDW5_STRT8|nr:hypothetical protein STRTUCAR8_01207 [Streptomyces turgidiscabies Car8]
MRPVQVQRLAQGTEDGGHRRQVVDEVVRQRRGHTEPGEIDGDHLALGGEDVDHRVPGLPVVPDAVQQEKRFAGAHTRVRQGHGPGLGRRAVRRGDLEGDGGGHGAAPLRTRLRSCVAVRVAVHGDRVDSLSANATDG